MNARASMARCKAIDLVGNASQLNGSEPHKIEENGERHRFPTHSPVSDGARRHDLNTAGVRCAQPLIGLKTPTKAGKFLPVSAEGGSHFAECFGRQPKRLKQDYALT
jgi:hypothetical protein